MYTVLLRCFFLFSIAHPFSSGAGCGVRTFFLFSSLSAQTIVIIQFGLFLLIRSSRRVDSTLFCFPVCRACGSCIGALLLVSSPHNHATFIFGRVYRTTQKCAPIVNDYVINKSIIFLPSSVYTSAYLASIICFGIRIAHSHIYTNKIK